MISCVNGGALRSHRLRTIWSHLRAQKLKFELRLTSPVLLAKQSFQVIIVREKTKVNKSAGKQIYFEYVKINKYKWSRNVENRADD